MGIKKEKIKVGRNHYYATGRRKTSTAKVFLREGTGLVIVNGLPIDEYFRLATASNNAKAPMQVVKMQDSLDAIIQVQGGGVMGQSGAVRHGLARALVKYDETVNGVVDTANGVAETADGVAEVLSTATAPATSFRRNLRSFGMLTRDSRKVERKKVGYRKARKVEQYSKR